MSWCLQRRWRTLDAGTTAAAGAANGEGGAEKCEMVRWAGTGGAGVLTCALACLCRAGQGAGYTWLAAGSTRRAKPAGGRPLNRPFNSFSDAMQCLTTCFDGELSAKPKLQSVNDLNNNHSPMYQLQLLFNELMLICNQNQVTSPQSWRVSAVSGGRLSENC